MCISSNGPENCCIVLINCQKLKMHLVKSPNAANVKMNLKLKHPMPFV